jgi:hypothetical protein
MRALLILLASCATTAEVPASATPAAPTGRLAGAPATLRPGVVHYDLPAVKPDQPQHHHHH